MPLRRKCVDHGLLFSDPRMSAQSDPHQNAYLLPRTSITLFSAAVGSMATASFATSPTTILDLYVVGAALFVAAGGFFSETILQLLRQGAATNALPVEADGLRAGFLHKRVDLFGERLRTAHAVQTRFDWLGVWLPAGLVILGSLIATTTLHWAWGQVVKGPAYTAHLPLLGGVLIVLAFPLLVLNRLYAGLAVAGTTNARSLERLLRMPLLACAALGCSALVRSLGYEWAWLIDRALMLMIALIVLELMLRVFAGLFLPVAPMASRCFCKSSVAGLLRPSLPSASSVSVAVEQQFGIDLSRSWAARFLLRAMVPVILVLIVFGWLLTGFTALGINQRGIYERFGRPVAVWGSGLHAHLPWPFGMVRRVELGVVHETPIVFPAQAPASSGSAASPESAPVAAEAMPPPSVDRLWDDLHPSEASFLIASAQGGLQGFQIVNIDLRVVYRIGMDDRSAMAAAYRVAEPDELIRAAAGRMLVRHFSQYTLADVLGENRAAFIGTFRNELQQRLDDLQTGTEIIAVVVEAIHPPPAAASAFHNVQAAQINALTMISQSRGNAYVTSGQAQQTAIVTRNAASASAAEQIRQARTMNTLFAADLTAYQGGAKVFLLEQWFEHVRRDVGRSPLLLLDHRLNGADQPTIDLRKFAQPGDPLPAGPAK